MQPFASKNSVLKTAQKLSVLLSLVLAASGLFVTQLAAQEYTVWRLNPAIPHAIANSTPNYSVTFSVQRLDAKGGYVQARVSKLGRPECFALFDYYWTFSSPLNVVQQDDLFNVKLDLVANPGSDCYPELDPHMNISFLAGAGFNSDLVGSFTNAEKSLILWGSKTPSTNGRIRLQHPQGPRSSGDIFQLKVDDTRTSNKSNQNAKRGAFFISMGYRGAVYQAYYIFSAQ